jgi:hypothetical protein
MLSAVGWPQFIEASPLDHILGLKEAVADTIATPKSGIKAIESH